MIATCAARKPLSPKVMSSVAGGETLLVGAEERALPDCGGGLQLVDGGRAGGQPEDAATARDRPRGDHQHLLPAPVQLGDLRADLVEDVRAQGAVGAGDD